jgi:hypothetical protein
MPLKTAQNEDMAFQHLIHPDFHCRYPAWHPTGQFALPNHPTPSHFGFKNQVKPIPRKPKQVYSSKPSLKTASSWLLSLSRKSL